MTKNSEHSLLNNLETILNILTKNTVIRLSIGQHQEKRICPLNIGSILKGKN